MPESFGGRLRQQREAQKIALVTIADETKIKLSLLEALERDDVSRWPSGIFRRAYIRAYAHAIGLSPDDVVREFLEAHPEPPEVRTADPASTPHGDEVRTAGGPPSRLRHLVGSALGSLSRLRRSPGADAPVAPPVPPPIEPAVAAPPAVSSPPPASVQAPDFVVLARLCTKVGQVENVDELRPLLGEAARILDAMGLIVWLWDPSATALRPVLAHGYSDKVLAQLPIVRRDADNATAAAFRSGRPCAVNGSETRLRRPGCSVDGAGWLCGCARAGAAARRRAGRCVQPHDPRRHARAVDG
jgi:transcriptional regulator with XRE-family HTH domain